MNDKQITEKYLSGTRPISVNELCSSAFNFTIPSYQRGYRWTSKEVIRLLKDILGYNKEKDGKFYCLQPLVLRHINNNGKDRWRVIDGQQRLTTLYLLHLYGNKCHNIQFEHLNNFSYETRTTSKDFINSIAEHWHGEKHDDKSLKEYIVEQGWFLDYWSLDPTVEAMLNMLTAIDERFRSNPDILNNLDRISFEFLDLNDLELNETLYLKMNSCGRKISQFDKIKSEIDKILPEQVPSDARCRFVLYSDEHLETLDSFDKKWRYCIDRKWSNLFWDRASHTYDTSFLSFLTNYLAASAGETYTYADSLLSVDFSDNTFYLPWKWFEAYIKVNKDYLEKVAAVLNKLVYNLDKAEDIVKEMLALPVSYLDRAKTFGLLSFSGDDFSSTEFVEWERFIRNYATHTVEDKRTFFAFTERITKEFSSKSTDILAYLSKKYKTAKHERTQLNEEYFKAHVILEGEEELELKIRSAEKHPLLEGRLRPLISDGTRYDEHSFPYIYENFCKYFGDDGKNLEFNDDGNNLKFKAELQSRTEFATAFVKGISRMDQLENQLIFDLSENGLKEKLKVQQLEPIFRKCLLSDKLTNIADEERQDQNDECVQIKDTLLKPGVIEGILKYKIGEKLRVHWYHNCRCLFPYNGKTSTDRIGFDHINNDEKQWTRKRNQVLSDLIKESYEVKEQPVSSVPGIALWWGSDIRFIPPAQYQDKNQSICLLWSADFNIGIIKGMDDTTWIKRRGKTAQENENYLFNAVGMDNNEIKEKIENMIKEYKDDQRI